jgi:quinol monooxygenase YgiN
MLISLIFSIPLASLVHGLSSPQTKMPSPFALNVKVSVLPSKRDEWLKQIKEDQKCSRGDEEGCLQFTLSEDTETPNTFYLHEQYVNRRAFIAHTQTPHFKKYDEYCKNEKPLDGEPELFMFRPLDEGEDWSKAKRDIYKAAYCVTVNLYPKAEVRDEFLKVIGNNKKGTDETEPLALQYTYGESTSKPNVFHFHEQYTGDDGGKQGFDAHAASPHFKDWETFVGTDPFSRDPEVFFSRVIED